ncbi:MAG: Hsp20/alpha crystallin family protein [Candidatus Schekmanbacteria bacterium]|nr:Hsp20/alpha crystallin family protein [Candidatus Schekmanbacteria bacterium]
MRTIARFDPFHELASFQHAVRRLFDDPHARLPHALPTAATGELRTEAYETPEGFVILVEIPGVAREDVHLSVEKRTVTIAGEKKQAVAAPPESYHLAERLYGAFSRSFALPDSADPSQVTARLRDGVLEIQLAKVSESRSRQIGIAVA